MTLRQLLVDAHGCTGPLDDAPALLAALRAAAAAVGAREQGNAVARYVPHGVTAVVILAESHVMVTTWPEHGLALVDILLCNDTMDPHVVWATLETVLQPERTTVQTLARTIG